MAGTKRVVVRRPTFHFTDLGFGSGEHLQALSIPNPRVKRAPVRRVLHGVEQPRAPRIRVPSARLNYQGFSSWLRKTKPKSQHVINADFFFENWFAQVKSLEKRIENLRKLREKLAPNGRLFVTTAQQNTEHMEGYLLQSGFESITSRPLREEETTTPYRKAHFEEGLNNPQQAPFLISARSKPPKRPA